MERFVGLTIYAMYAMFNCLCAYVCMCVCVNRRQFNHTTMVKMEMSNENIDRKMKTIRIYAKL